MLATGAAAEISPRQEHTGSCGQWLIEFKLRIERAILKEPPVEEEKLSKARPLNSYEDLLGDNLVSVDIGPVELGHNAGMGGEGLHGLLKKVSDSSNGGCQ